MVSGLPLPSPQGSLEPGRHPPLPQQGSAHPSARLSHRLPGKQHWHCNLLPQGPGNNMCHSLSASTAPHVPRQGPFCDSDLPEWCKRRCLHPPESQEEPSLSHSLSLSKEKKLGQLDAPSWFRQVQPPGLSQSRAGTRELPWQDASGLRTA